VRVLGGDRKESRLASLGVEAVLAQGEEAAIDFIERRHKVVTPDRQRPCGTIDRGSHPLLNGVDNCCSRRSR
jgi:hypothetical protein